MEQKENKTLTMEDKVDQLVTMVAVLCNSVDIMRKDYNKIIYALIGIVAATLGLKFVATPWYVDTAIYLCTFAGVFVLLHLISVWKDLNLANRVMRIVGSALFIFSSVTQLIIYRPGDEPSPKWFPPTINILLILLAISMTWAIWNHKSKKKTRGCSEPPEKGRES